MDKRNLNPFLKKKILTLSWWKAAKVWTYTLEPSVTMSHQVVEASRMGVTESSKGIPLAEEIRAQGPEAQNCLPIRT